MAIRTWTLAGLLFVAPATGQETTLTTVVLGDGTRVLLRTWELVHDIQTWPRGQPPSGAGSIERKGNELILAKRQYALAGHKLELIYPAGKYFAREVALVSPDGKRSVLKVEQPVRELLNPELDKNTMSMARSLELTGETLTGTRRTFCLLSFSALVTCSNSPEYQVVLVEFAP